MNSTRILIADDSKTERLILQSLLKQQGYPVYVARDGSEAIQTFKEVKPDIVLLDAIMPNVDGYEAAIAIKELSGEDFVPILFVTSLTDVDSLARCLEVGGDDFLTKPFNKIILKAKIEAFVRMKKLYKISQQQKNKISHFHDKLVQEQKLARKIFDNIAHKGCLKASNIQYNLSPMSIFNGDILLAAEKPVGGMHIFLGDFTGHGLPAAIGAMPVSEIFYGMTLKGFALEEILKEINSRLNNILPTGVFCCAIAADIDFELQSCKVWNGGVPDGYVVERDKGIVERLVSQHLPLGLQNNNKFSTETIKLVFNRDMCLFFATDGIIEAENLSKEMYGSSRLEQVLNNSVVGHKPIVNSINQSLLEFTGKEAQSDDISFIKVSGIEPEMMLPIMEVTSAYNKPLKWTIEYCLAAESLKGFDPLPLIVQPLMEVNALRTIRSKIFTILSELYANALEHGVLGLESIEKSDAKSFKYYYLEKEYRLKKLESAEIKIKIHLESFINKGTLKIIVNDSGEGFNFKELFRHNENDNYHGRGVLLLQELCDEICYKGDGSEVEITILW